MAVCQSCSEFCAYLFLMMYKFNESCLGDCSNYKLCSSLFLLFSSLLFFYLCFLFVCLFVSGEGGGLLFLFVNVWQLYGCLI